MSHFTMSRVVRGDSDVEAFFNRLMQSSRCAHQQLIDFFAEAPQLHAPWAQLPVAARRSVSLSLCCDHTTMHSTVAVGDDAFSLQFDPASLVCSVVSCGRGIRVYISKLNLNTLFVLF